jgi:hypothetical protein
MALQTSGLISMAQINQELGRNSTGQISLNVYAVNNGAVVQVGSGTVSINQCSAARPNAINPMSITEWYGYNHTASCIEEAMFTMSRYNTNALATYFFQGQGGPQYEFRFRELGGVWYTVVGFADGYNTLSTDSSNPNLIAIDPFILFYVFTNPFFVGRTMEAQTRKWTNGVPGNWSTVVQES